MSMPETRSLQERVSLVWLSRKSYFSFANYGRNLFFTIKLDLFSNKWYI